MPSWSDITHAGSFVKTTVKKGKTIYRAAMHDVSDVFDDATEALGLGSFESELADGIEHTTQFMLTKANGLVKHYIDSDGDGIFNKKKDDLIGKVKMPSGSFFADPEGEAHSIFGDHGTLYSAGTEAASEIYQNHLGFVHELPDLGALGATADDVVNTLIVVSPYLPLLL